MTQKGGPEDAVGRLALLESLILERPGQRLVDIGADHASLPIRLMKAEVYKRVLVTDIRPGPLENARKRAAEADLNQGFESCLADGLDGIEVGGGDLLLISGLGGETLASILEAHPQKAKRVSRLILQPQSREEVLRQSLVHLGLPLSDERCVQEGGQVYLILVSDPKDPAEGDLTDLQLYFGPRILERMEAGPDEALAAYLRKRLRRLKKQAPYDPRPAQVLAEFQSLRGHLSWL